VVYHTSAFISISSLPRNACIKDRHEILGGIDVGANCVRPHLSEYGIVVEAEIAILSATYSTADVIKYVIMPNHIHLILSIANDDGRTQFAPVFP